MNKQGNIPFWSWNDLLQKEELKKQMERMRADGVTGFFMHARGGMRTPYLSPEWFECVRFCVSEAERLGMEAWAYDENGWPSGYVGGKLLSDAKNRDRYLTASTGAFDKNALVSYDGKAEKLLRVTEGEDCINVYLHISTSTVDVLNADVVEQFLTLTHDEYKKRGVNVEGFFTDEPQYFRWQTPYSPVVAEYFQSEYGEDILDGLGFLFCEKEGYRAFRYKYWLAMQTLFLKNYTEKIYERCNRHGYRLTGHFIEETSISSQMLCCAGVMPQYEFQHVPGIDYLGRWVGNRVAVKQLGSAAAQLGKKYRLSESYGCAGWDVTPLELKRMGDLQFAYGVNVLCQHLIPYSERGARKRDYPAHYTPLNPWCKEEFSTLVDYYANFSQLLTESEEVVNVAVFHPMRSGYLYYRRDKESEGFGISELDAGLERLTEELLAAQVGFHFIDETLLERHGKIEGKRLRCGEYGYEYLVFPLTYTVGKQTKAFIEEFIRGGGRVLFTAGAPQYVEGNEGDFSSWRSNVTWEDLLRSQPLTATPNKNVCSTLRKKDGELFLLVANVWEDTEVEFSFDGYTAWESIPLHGNGEREIVGRKFRLKNGESRMLKPSNLPVTEKTLADVAEWQGVFEIESADDNAITLDFVRYSYDGVTYSEKINVRRLFQKLIKEQYEGDLYLKYAFDVSVLPPKATFVCEYAQVRINGAEMQGGEAPDFGVGFYAYDVTSRLQKGVNEVFVQTRYFQRQEVYDILFDDTIARGLKTSLTYDCEIESAYLFGQFGVYGNFTPTEKAHILLGDGFSIGALPARISSLVEEGFPFFAGKICLKRNIFLATGKERLRFDGRLQSADVYLNGGLAGNLLFSREIDLAGQGKAGENELKIVLTVGRRNLFGPFHGQKTEELPLYPGSWDGNARQEYSFIKTIL